MNFCLGTVQFGMDYGIQGNVQPELKNIYDMLDYAVEHEITHFDTASAYGMAENVLGGYIREYPGSAERMNIISKLKPEAFLNSSRNDWPGIALENARKSMECLGIKKFSSYLFHNASFIFDEDAVTALYSVVEYGLADRIGVSVYTPEEALKALDYSQIGTIQIPYNVFDRRLDKFDFFKRASEMGITVYARSSLLQGLAVMDPEKLPDRVAFAKEYLLKYEAICSEFSLSKLDAAIGYVVQKTGIDYVVFGVDNLKQLEEYTKMKNITVPDEFIHRIDKLFDSVPDKLVNPSLWK